MTASFQPASVFDFRGKTAVVTGGGSGMGRELVRQLAAEAVRSGIRTDGPAVVDEPTGRGVGFEYPAVVGEDGRPEVGGNRVVEGRHRGEEPGEHGGLVRIVDAHGRDRKSTRLNSSH